MSLPIRLVVAAALTLVPAIASASPRVSLKLHRKHPRVARASHACLKAPIEFLSASSSDGSAARVPERGDRSAASRAKDDGTAATNRERATSHAAAESATFALAKCDGTLVPAAVDRLSQLVGAPSGHRLDTRLVEQLEAAIDHFRGREVPRVVVLSGYRPPGAGNYHSTGRALDLRIDGVENEALFAFCKTLPDTGCGSYPNSSFVHVDVREPGTGHVSWTDVGAPGDSPRYVSDEAPTTSSLPPLPPAP